MQHSGGAVGKLESAFDGPRMQTRRCAGALAGALGQWRGKTAIADYNRMRRAWEWAFVIKPRLTGRGEHPSCVTVARTFALEPARQ